MNVTLWLVLAARLEKRHLYHCLTKVHLTFFWLEPGFSNNF